MYKKKCNTQISFAVKQDGFVLKFKRQNTVKHLPVAQVNVAK